MKKQRPKKDESAKKMHEMTVVLTGQKLSLPNLNEGVESESAAIDAQKIKLTNF